MRRRQLRVKRHSPIIFFPLDRLERKGELCRIRSSLDMFVYRNSSLKGHVGNHGFVPNPFSLRVPSECRLSGNHQNRMDDRDEATAACLVLHRRTDRQFRGGESRQSANARGKQKAAIRLHVAHDRHALVSSRPIRMRACSQSDTLGRCAYRSGWGICRPPRNELRT